MRPAAILLIAACLYMGPAFSQSYESNITYNKKKQKAIVLECGYPEEAAENAIIEKLKGLGNKSREEKGMFNGDKGFIVFRNAYVTDISDKDMDFIVKVERKSRKEKDMTNVYLVITKNGENMLTSSDSYTEHAKEARSLLQKIKASSEDCLSDQDDLVSGGEEVANFESGEDVESGCERMAGADDNVGSGGQGEAVSLERGSSGSHDPQVVERPRRLRFKIDRFADHDYDSAKRRRGRNGRCSG